VEEVRPDGVPAQAPARTAAADAHPVGADRDGVDGRHLEAGVVEAPVGAGDEAEHVVVAGSGIEERDPVVVDGVADAQPQDLGVEVGHRAGLGGEQQGVTQPAGQHVLGGFGPLGDVEPLLGGAHVDQDVGHRPRRGRFGIEQLHGGAVGIADPQAVLGGAGRGLDDRRSGPVQGFADGVGAARAQRERDVMQALDRRPDQAHLLLVTARAPGHQRAVLLLGFEAEVLQEAFCGV
jgi:hypothetical protein